MCSMLRASRSGNEAGPGVLKKSQSCPLHFSQRLQGLLFPSCGASERQERVLLNHVNLEAIFVSHEGLQTQRLAS